MRRPKMCSSARNSMLHRSEDVCRCNERKHPTHPTPQPLSLQLFTRLTQICELNHCHNPTDFKKTTIDNTRSWTACILTCGDVRQPKMWSCARNIMLRSSADVCRCNEQKHPNPRHPTSTPRYHVAWQSSCA